MATTYAYQKGKYGGPTGSIFPFFRDFVGVSPADEEYYAFVPAGFLRCRGQVLSANQYPALAAILGVGDNCIYKKSTTSLQNPATDGTGGTFQLPDLGSKYISAGTTPGQYNNLTLSDSETVVYKAGIEVTLESVGDEVFFTYDGDFSFPTHDLTLFGNWTAQSTTLTTNSTVSDGQIMTHGHYANVTQLHDGQSPGCGYSWKYQPCYGGGWSWLNLCACNSSATVNKTDFVGDLYSMGIEFSELGSDTSTLHYHSNANPKIIAQTKSGTLQSTVVSSSSIVTNVRLNTANTVKIDAMSPKFILCEFLIKY